MLLFLSLLVDIPFWCASIVLLLWLVDAAAFAAAAALAAATAALLAAVCKLWWAFEKSLRKSNFLWLFDAEELLNAECSERGGKCSPGNASPAAAAACNDCKSAAECSCALRLNSATELERGSDVKLLIVDVADVDDDDDDDDVAVDDTGGKVGGFMGQHEHNPGNPTNYKI